jgi:hypothetical protein
MKVIPLVPNRTYNTYLRLLPRKRETLTIQLHPLYTPIPPSVLLRILTTCVLIGGEVNGRSFYDK